MSLAKQDRDRIVQALKKRAAVAKARGVTDEIHLSLGAPAGMSRDEAFNRRHALGRMLVANGFKITGAGASVAGPVDMDVSVTWTRGEFSAVSRRLRRLVEDARLVVKAISGTF